MRPLLALTVPDEDAQYAATRCRDCGGAGRRTFEWGTVQVEKVCRACVGSGWRGRHRK